MNLSVPPSRQAPSRANASARTQGVAAAWWFAALVGHGGLAYAAWQAPVLRNSVRETIQVRILAAPPKRPEATPVAPVINPPEEPAIKPTRPVARKPAPKPLPAPEETKAAPEQIPEVVGLTVASTAIEGTGPAFATGQTLSGVTKTVAKPYVVATVDPPIAPTNTMRPSRNRVARAQAASGTRVELARRLSQIQPEYPALLQSQRIEGDVTVRVTLSAQGAVQHVELVRAASETAFNDAALAAARRERFVPEIHDGRPVSTSLTYTYRFRINP